MEKFQNKEVQDLMNKIFKVEEREASLLDLNNYVLVKEENLNNEILNK